MGIPLVDLKAEYASIKDEIDKALASVITNTSFVKGPFLKAFEENLASFSGVKHGIGTTNGTDSIYLLLKALGIGPGDEVIMPSHTFISTGESTVRAGAKPVFVDVDEHTQLIDPSLIPAKVTKRTKAIMPVHLFGQMADMKAIKAVAEKHHLKVIEDAAQAIGAERDGVKPGQLSDGAILSFFPSKTLGAFGDGGAVLTNNDEVAEQIHLMRDHGRPATEKYRHFMIGYNHRMAPLQAAVLDVKLKHLRGWIARREKHAQRYSEELSHVSGVTVPYYAPNAKSAHYVYTIRHPRRDDLQKHLKEQGIGTGVYYPVPLHLQPVFATLGHKKGDFPVTEKLCDDIISLPFHPFLTEEAIMQVVDAIKTFGEEKKTL